jgi:hypothetical protein
VKTDSNKSSGFTLEVLNGKVIWKNRPLRIEDYDEIVSLLRTHLGLRHDRLWVQAVNHPTLSNLCITWQTIRELVLPPSIEPGSKEYKLRWHERETLNMLREKLDEQIAASEDGGGFLPWVVLPTGEGLWQTVEEYVRRNRSNTEQKYQPERVTTIRDLKPDAVYLGTAGMNGYFVAVFESRQKAICERPFYGNAIYILKGDWKALSKKSKAELLHEHPEECIRLVHIKSWAIWLKFELERS